MEQRLISYTKGITTSPGELLAEDGELLECINLKCENGELKPLLWPEESEFTLEDGEELLFVHKTSLTSRAFYIKKENKLIICRYGLEGDRYKDEITHDFKNLVNVDVVGNTSIVIDDEGIHYILKYDEGYKYLGMKPPMLRLGFELIRVGDEAKTELISLPNSSDYEDHNEYIKVCNDAVMGGVNKVTQTVFSEGCFLAPFILRYAYRMYDGTSYMQSIPILFPVNTYLDAFVVKETKFEHVTITDRACAFSMALYYKVLDDSILNTLKSDWKDIIKGVDIAVTPQFLGRDPNKDGFLIHNFVRPSDSLKSRLSSSYTIVYDKDEYNPAATRIVFFDMLKTDRFLTLLVENEQGELYFPMLKDEDFINKEIREASIFYKYDYIPIESLETSYTKIKAEGKDFNTISTWSILEDDYISNFNIKAENIYVFNNKVNLSSVSKNCATPFLIQDFYPPFYERVDDTLGDCYVLLSYEGDLLKSKLGNNDTNDKVMILNKYFYYPDVNAESIYIRVTKHDGTVYLNRYYKIPLKKHERLNGSVYFEGFNSSLDTVADNMKYEDAGYIETDKLYSSSLNNPFVYAPSGIITVGTGFVISLIGTTRALSQGQFGQFPLLCFTTDGIWALEVGSDGSFSAKQAISREICNNKNSILQTDDAVYFSTEKGLMKIVGSDVLLVTPQMNGLNTDVNDMKRMGDMSKDFSSNMHNIVTSCSDEKEFVNFLRESRAGYNYREGSIYFANKDFDYMYVYYISNNAVVKLYNPNDKVVSFVNDYPDTLASGRKKVYSLLTEHDIDGAHNEGFAMTRALKLGNPASLKKIRQLKNLKNVYDKDSAIKCSLWGSNDNINWYPIGNMRGIFKYYRMGLFTKLRPTEGLSGSVIMIEEKRNNKLR